VPLPRPTPGLAPLRPTRVRYLIVLVATLMAVLLYLHRFCLSFAELYITEDLRLTTGQAAWLLSAFFWTYALAQVPAGWLGDRFGVRLMLALYILLWSLCTGLVGAAAAFGVVLALRFGCGLAQAGAYPTSAALLGDWVPFGRRGLASSIVSNGGRLGGAIAPVLTAYLIVAFAPPGTPALLDADDLLNVPRLCAAICRTDDTPAAPIGQRLLSLLPAAAARAVREEAAAPPGAPLDDDRRRLLLDGLNEVLRRRDFVRPEDVTALPLSREALALAGRPREELSGAEVERLNRLALEAAYPDGVKKLYARGWRPVLLVYGAAGLIVAALFWLVVRNRPEQHPLCNTAEVRLIEAGRPAEAASSRDGLPLGPIVRSRSLWLCSAAQFGTNLGWTFLLTWLPRYLEQVHRVPIVERGWMAGLPILVGMGGQLAGGWLTDRLTRSLGLRLSRVLPMGLSRFVAMAAFLLCPLLGSPWAVTAALAVVALATDLGTPSVWAYSQDVGGRHVGSVLGWGNMWGNLGSALSPLLLSAVVAAWGWPALFVTCAAAFLFAGVTALGVDATEPVFPPEKGPK
jgi:MFS transporter, ACS family, glucarate transporter